MHYYQFNISDYRKDTNHLSLLEHGIYRMLIDTYYLNESPLCADDAQLMRTHNIRTEDDKIAFKNVINDFFIKKDDGYHHSGCDERMKEVYEKSEKARLSAQKRWNKKRTQCERIENASESQCERNANGMLPNTYNLEPNKNNSQESKIPPCPHEKIIDLYHKTLPELQTVNKTLWKGSKREKDLTARWRQNEEFRKSEFWNWYFNSVKQSVFHMGENDRQWKADLGWLIKKDNFIKMVEKFSS